MALYSDITKKNSDIFKINVTIREKQKQLMIKIFSLENRCYVNVSQLLDLTHVTQISLYVS